MTLPMPSLDAAPAPVRIAIIEDHELLADALACALGRDGFDVVVVRPASFPAIIDHVRELSPGIVLLDLHLGDLGSSVSLIDPLREVGAEVICVTGETARATWGACVEAGASAVLSKSTPFDELVGRIGAVIAGEAGMPTSERVALLQDVREHRAEARVRLEPFQRLTVRECEVLRELMDGLSADAIAERAFVSLTTVRSHIRGILQKLGVSSQLAAVAMATRAGWSSPHRRPG